MKTAKKPLFELGRCVMTPGAIRVFESENGALEPADHYTPSDLVKLHQSGDWGVLDPEDVKANDEAVENGDRILSAYKLTYGKLWVITEADRSVTTILEPDEY